MTATNCQHELTTRRVQQSAEPRPCHRALLVHHPVVKARC
eukprot:CAMPEP_0115310006 /NCGR_PEP_ID=MMETSP0270-20121206/74559_1 /TAXON_ID=71861 /ORGANISM="Scrippsiella trochoidea, Strain CCMP3099" /LENGTH=39 /DNA_ID= /DNA_START= /DNA_END= /DNA_ORIENTATION=